MTSRSGDKIAQTSKQRACRGKVARGVCYAVFQGISASKQTKSRRNTAQRGSMSDCRQYCNCTVQSGGREVAVVYVVVFIVQMR